MTTVSTSLDTVSDGSQTFESASDGTGRKPITELPSSDESCDFQDAVTGYETTSNSNLAALNQQDDRNLHRFLESLKQSPAEGDQTEPFEATQPDTIDGETVLSATPVILPKRPDCKPSLVTLDRGSMPSTKTKTTKRSQRVKWADETSTLSGSAGIATGPQNGADGDEQSCDDARSDAGASRVSSPFRKTEEVPNDPRGGDWVGDDTTSDIDTHFSSILKGLRNGGTVYPRGQASSIPQSAANEPAPSPTTEPADTKSVLSSFRDWAASKAPRWGWRGDTEPARNGKTAKDTVLNFSRPNRLNPTSNATTTAAATTRSTLTRTTYDYASSAYRHVSRAVQSFYSSRVAPYIPAATRTLNSWVASLVSGVGDLARRAKDWAEQSQTLSRAGSHLGSTLWLQSVMSKGKNVATDSLSGAHGEHAGSGLDAGSSQVTIPEAGSVTGRQTGGIRMRH